MGGLENHRLVARVRFAAQRAQRKNTTRAALFLQEAARKRLRVRIERRERGHRIACVEPRRPFPDERELRAQGARVLRLRDAWLISGIPGVRGEARPGRRRRRRRCLAGFLDRDRRWRDDRGRRRHR